MRKTLILLSRWRTSFTLKYDNFKELSLSPLGSFYVFILFTKQDIPTITITGKNSESLKPTC